MNFFKCAAYVLFALSICNLAFTGYVFNELKKPNIIVAPNEDVKVLQMQSMTRDTQLFQGILMVHHQIGLHKPGAQQMCPICDEINEDGTNTITVNHIEK